MTRHRTRSAPAASAQRATPPSSTPRFSAPESGNPPDISDFDPVELRARHDGWTSARQTGFVAALAACGCVAEAAARVGMNARSAYKLRARPSARSFREAWDTALAHAVECLSDAVFSRALSGVERPIFFQGERIGEWRQYDERLAMFILARRAPDRYGAWIDRREVRCERDQTAAALGEALRRIAEDAAAPNAEDRDDGASAAPLPERDPLPAPVFYTESQASQRGMEREAMPSAEETDALILEKLDALNRSDAMRCERIAGGGQTKGDVSRPLRTSGGAADEEDWDEAERDGEDRDGEDRDGEEYDEEDPAGADETGMGKLDPPLRGGGGPPRSGGGGAPSFLRVANGASAPSPGSDTSRGAPPPLGCAERSPSTSRGGFKRPPTGS